MIKAKCSRKRLVPECLPFGHEICSYHLTVNRHNHTYRDLKAHSTTVFTLSRIWKETASYDIKSAKFGSPSPPSSSRQKSMRSSRHQTKGHQNKNKWEERNQISRRMRRDHHCEHEILKGCSHPRSSHKQVMQSPMAWGKLHKERPLEIIIRSILIHPFPRRDKVMKCSSSSSLTPCNRH